MRERTQGAGSPPEAGELFGEGEVNDHVTSDRVDIRKEIAVVRDAHLASLRSHTHEQWVEEAKRLINRDMDGVVPLQPGPPAGREPRG